MNRKQNISKDEARILLNSQPLSATLWKLASDNLKQDVIHFPNPSYVDSQSWPDYMKKKAKNEVIVTNKNVISETVVTESKLQRSNPDQVIESKKTTSSIGEIFAELDVKPKSASQEKMTKEKVKTIPISVKKKEKQSVKKPAKVSSQIKKKTQTSKAVKPALPKKNDSDSKNTPDFYEWLEKLRNTPKPSPKRNSSKTVKITNNKTGVEVSAAKIKAENSLVLGGEIVSETLARLLVKQGHKEKAIEMYEKLILKYPEKVGTFAAALQKLKS